jgi:hypothetical protein
VNGQAPTEAAERLKRFAEAVRQERARLVPGAVEKYPAATAKVRILDAESLIAELAAQRDVVTRLKDELTQMLYDQNWSTDEAELHVAAVVSGTEET